MKSTPGAVHRRSPGARATAAGLVAILALMAAPARADAHAILLHTTPANGAHLPTAPREISLTFDEPISAAGLQVAVTDVAGRTLSAPRPRLDGTTVVQPLPPVPDGPLTVAYRVTSDDGHPVQGLVSFTIGVATAAPTPGPDAHRSGKLVWAYGVLAAALVALAAGGLLLAGERTTGRRT